VITNKLNYENIIGKILDPSTLKKSLKAFVSIPENLSSAIELSQLNNPKIKIAKFELEQAEKDVEIARSDLSPTATLSLERSYSEDLSTTYNEREKDILKATISWPFYSGGKKIAKVNKNHNLKVRKRLLLDNAIKTNNTNVASAWSNLLSSKSFLASVRSQVKASEIANEGISAEYERGSRTTLDVIQSNTLLLNAQISLANSERNYLLAQYNLLKSIGLLNSNYLKLK
jgi:outer membrane protein